MSVEMETGIGDIRYLWNSTNPLLPPSLKFFESTQQISRSVRQIIVSEFNAYVYLETLFTETVALSRFMNERKNKYRSDKGFRTIQKIIKVGEKIHHVDLKSAILLIKSNLSGSLVPSKQLCQWILLKLQSSAVLLHRLDGYCTSAASKLHLRLRTGHNWIEITMALSMISRIWTMSRIAMRSTLASYEKLKSCLASLKSSRKEEHWLHRSYEFPDNLHEWIIHSCEYGTLLTSDGKESQPQTNIGNIGSGDSTKIDSKVFEVVSNITNARDLKVFFRKEEALRSSETSRGLCVSKKLDALQWHMLQKRVFKWLKDLEENSDQVETRISRIQKKLYNWFT